MTSSSRSPLSHSEGLHLAAPLSLSLPKPTSRPVIGFDQTRTRHGKRGDVTSKASFQLSEFGLIGLFAVYGILRIAGIDPFARKPPTMGGAWGGGSYGEGYYQGVIDALRNVPGAGTFGGIGQKAPGGGGYGHPYKRPVELVVRDVNQRFISPEAGRVLYGVSVRRTNGHYELDAEGTAALRAGARQTDAPASGRAC